MKLLLPLCAALLVGCAEYKTLEELELAALESGDWSAVERRERVIAKRKAQSACGAGQILVCESRTGDKQCYCASNDSVRALLDGL